VTDTPPATAVVQCVLPATPERVFDQWIDPDALADWMCPRPAKATNIALDATVGGHLHLDIVEDDTTFTVTGTFLTLDRPHSLQFTWSCSTWDDPTIQSIVTVTLEPHRDTHTLISILHTLLPPDTITQHQHGWALVADQLAMALARQ
jgi:uncharacterized protein YndB with AHSA1/START domain